MQQINLHNNLGHLQSEKRDKYVRETFTRNRNIPSSSKTLQSAEENQTINTTNQQHTSY